MSLFCTSRPAHVTVRAIFTLLGHPSPATALPFPHVLSPLCLGTYWIRISSSLYEAQTLHGECCLYKTREWQLLCSFFSVLYKAISQYILLFLLLNLEILIFFFLDLAMSPRLYWFGRIKYIFLGFRKTKIIANKVKNSQVKRPCGICFHLCIKSFFWWNKAIDIALYLDHLI